MGCAAETFPGQLVPLDLYVMLDRSSSMKDSSKWSNVVAALNTFIGDKSSAGIGVGLQYFPTKPAVPVPATCPCGAYGPCLGAFCGGTLSPDDSCVATDYANPALGIGVLPGAAGALQGSLGATEAKGSSTPSQPAMEGAVIYASDWAKANPSHLTFVLFASDGEPTNCTTNSINGTAAAAAAAAADVPPVKTFVIGVGKKLTNLNKIAAAGGTEKAYLVDSGKNTTQEFIDALNEIRSAGQCKFQIPVPDVGTPDFGKVNVTLVDPNDPTQKKELKYVTNAAGCDPVEGGWYYDDPNDPKVIELCPASCDHIMLTDWDVKVILGCKTIVK